jgi:hypothetical protein
VFPKNSFVFIGGLKSRPPKAKNPHPATIFIKIRVPITTPFILVTVYVSRKISEIPQIDLAICTNLLRTVRFARAVK